MGLFTHYYSDENINYMSGSSLSWRVILGTTSTPLPLRTVFGMHIGEIVGIQ